MQPLPSNQRCPIPESHIYNPGWSKYVGWEVSQNPNLQFLFDKDRMLTYQRKITELLQGVREDGRPILVPLDTIGNVLFQCYQTNQTTTASIYSKYIQPQQRNDITMIVDRAINIIVTQIRNEYEMAENNRKLTIWDSVLGDFNKHGLRAHPPIKIRKGGPERFQFHMRY